MAVRIVRLGSPRARGEGLRIGTVRRLPRGVRKQDYASLDYFDVWLPELSPSADLVDWVRAAPFTPARLRTFERRYRSEMRRPGPQRLIGLLAALSQQTNFAVGCYCADETHCHRTILREILSEQGAKLA